MENFQLPVFSNPTENYTEALTVNTITANNDLVLPNRNTHWFVRAIELISVQNLAWELWLFSKAANMAGTMQTDYLIGMWQFGPWVAGMGTTPSSPGYPVYQSGSSPADQYYRAYIDGLVVPYRDQDLMDLPNPDANVPLGQGVSNASIPFGKLHTRLVNRSPNEAKIAGASGAVMVTIYVQPAWPMSA